MMYNLAALSELQILKETAERLALEVLFYGGRLYLIRGDLLVEVATFVETLDDTFNLWIPIALISVGAALVILGLRRVRRPNADPEEMSTSRAKRDIGTPSDRVGR